MYNDGGAPLSDEKRVNEATALNQSGPQVLFDGPKRAVVAWTSEKPVPGNSKTVIAARRFDVSGDPRGHEIQVSREPAPVRLMRPELSSVPSIGVDGHGRYLISWSSMTPRARWVPLAQRFDARGRRLGKEYLLRPGSKGEGFRMAMDPRGEFLLVWDAFDPNERRRDTQDVYAAAFRPDGRRVGEAQRLNRRVDREQFDVQIAVGAHRAVAVWTDYVVGTRTRATRGYDVWGRFFRR